ncbi:ketoacyl-ACP synthase III [Lihuaxuella thermophila]|uniref:Beta-ketoacyl-[acyl-carrier-protein] synthase III n=1 Tax=Lihuaxuella thermophila TaxID=1173111 RepID=A0A1H8BFQ3_9BACL|nr:ketoacyl-ACP synthase III [Lihuaxuella thermophila]SEM81319.1 3-oxoacyl-[acyl-carrier-protein] synthase-3 [Lihuaxuella thermophila]
MLSPAHIQSKARITAIGSYVPERILSNADLERMVDTSDEWIVQRTGIRERRIAPPDVFTSDLCVKAVQNMVEQFQVSIADVDMILVATTTPDFPFPSVACLVQERLGIPSAGALDISAACAGFVYALNLANGLITSGLHRKVLVIGGETLSKVTDYSDRTTCILFGDGAGAALVEKDEHQPSFLHSVSGSDGRAGIHLYRTGISDRLNGVCLSGEGNIVQNGREVFKLAVSTLNREIPKLMQEAGMSLDELDWFVPHSANIRIIQAVCERIGFPMEKTLFSAEYYGNTSSATIPLALHLGLREGKLKKGNTVLLHGFGGGFVHSASLITWTV